MGQTNKKTEQGWTLQKALPWLFLVGGIIVTIASIALANEVYQRLKNPSYIPACNLNPILSCTNVADSSQAHALGIPNYFIGIGGYAALAAIGAAMLAGAKFKRWFWQLVEAGLVFAFLFMSWLQYETIYRIGALCLFCMVLWAFTGPLFWYTTLYNLDSGNLPGKLTNKFPRITSFARRHHAEILIVWFLIIIALILKRFWYYWSTL